MENKAVINYPLVTTDSKGNVVHRKDSDTVETWKQYDKNNKLTYCKTHVFEEWFEYDEKDKLKFIHRKYSSGTEVWFDSKENKIPNPNLIKEVTLEEIAEKFKISVKNLRIKE
jgi:hypothetical protein